MWKSKDAEQMGKHGIKTEREYLTRGERVYSSPTTQKALEEVEGIPAHDLHHLWEGWDTIDSKSKGLGISLLFLISATE